MTNLVSPHEALILDACCAINLFATDQSGAILRSIGCPVVVARFVVERKLQPSPFPGIGPLPPTNAKLARS